MHEEHDEGMIQGIGEVVLMAELSGRIKAANFRHSAFSKFTQHSILISSVRLIRLLLCSQRLQTSGNLSFFSVMTRLKSENLGLEFQAKIYEISNKQEYYSAIDARPHTATVCYEFLAIRQRLSVNKRTSFSLGRCKTLVYCSSTVSHVKVT